MPTPYYKSPEEVPTSRYIEHPYKPGVFLPVHRRPMRLPGVDYASRECTCFVTFNVLPREPIFTDDVGKTAWEAILEVRDFKGSTLHAACLMPDHAHILVSPSGAGESVSDIVGAIKKRQDYHLRRRHRIPLNWQERFYDHVLGRCPDPQEEFDCIVCYIRENPVRAGLVTVWTDHPFVL